MFLLSAVARTGEADTGIHIAFIDTVTIDHRRLTVHDFRQDSIYLAQEIGLALSGGGAREHP